MVDLGDVQRETGQFGRRGHHVPARHLADVPFCEAAEMAAGQRVPVGREVPSGRDRGHVVPAGVGSDHRQVVGVPGPGRLVPHRQHGAAPEVQDGAAFLIDRADPQRGQARRLPVRPSGVPPEADDLGHRPQRVAQPRRPPEDHPGRTGWPRPCASPSSTARSRRPRRGSARPGHSRRRAPAGTARGPGRAARCIRRRPGGRRPALGQGLAGTVRETLPVPQILEVRSVDHLRAEGHRVLPRRRGRACAGLRPRRPGRSSHRPVPPHRFHPARPVPLRPALSTPARPPRPWA